MDCRFVTFLIFLTYTDFAGINGQVSEGVPCETPNEEYGLCINIYNCSQLMDLLINQSNNPRIRTYLRSSTCGYEGSTPMVCCPQPRIQTSPTSSTESPQNEFRSTPQTNTVYTLPQKPNCGRSNYSNPRIVNGVPAKLGEFPWITALGYRNSKNPNSPKWLCGASLITERHILTAAHCVYNRNDLYVARLGDLDLYATDDGADPETIPIKNAKIHEDYSPRNFTNDIAILTLDRSPRKSTAWPICLPLENNLRNNNYLTTVPTVAGWGSTYFNGPSSPTLQEVVIPVIDNERCRAAYGTKAIIDDNILCAGYLRGGKDACQGDSGGPLMHRIANKQGEIFSYQIGIVSYGIRCAEAKNPGVYTRVTAFLDWIQKNIN